MAIVVRELTPSLLADWLAFFDNEAFVDNREWAACYCHFYHADDREKEFDSRTASENRAAASQLIAAGALRGYLACSGAQAVGWCQAAPRTAIPNLARDASLAHDDDPGVGSIVCFIVAPTFRRQGVAARLLEAACEGLRAQGMRIAEAYPRRLAEGDAANCHGPLQLYLEAGFEVERQLEISVVVRRRLQAPAGV